MNYPGVQLKEKQETHDRKWFTFQGEVTRPQPEKSDTYCPQRNAIWTPMLWSKPHIPQTCRIVKNIFHTHRKPQLTLLV
jgi:hypothetical protein